MRHTVSSALFLSAAALLLSACSAQGGVVATPVPLPTSAPSDSAFQSPAEAPSAASPERALVDPAIQDLAVRLGVAPQAIDVVEVSEVDWPDASLGCPAPDMGYAQVITPGMQVILANGGQSYVYHGRSPNDLFLCGPEGPLPPAG